MCKQMKKTEELMMVAMPPVMRNRISCLVVLSPKNWRNFIFRDFIAVRMGKNGDPNGIRIRIPTVKGWCPNR